MNQPFQHPLLASLSGADLQSIAERAVSDPRWRSSERLLRKIGREDLIADLVVYILERTKVGRWASDIPARAIAWKSACWGMMNIIRLNTLSSRADRYASGHVSVLQDPSGRETDVFEQMPDERSNPEFELLCRESCEEQGGGDFGSLEVTPEEEARACSRSWEAQIVSSLRLKLTKAGNKELAPTLIGYPYAVQIERLTAALEVARAETERRRADRANVREQRRDRFLLFILRLCPWVSSEIEGLSENDAGNIIFAWADRVRALAPDGSLTYFNNRRSPLTFNPSTGELSLARAKVSPGSSVEVVLPKRAPAKASGEKPIATTSVASVRSVDASFLKVERERARMLTAVWDTFVAHGARAYGLERHIAPLSALPIEERVKSVEARVYDARTSKRLVLTREMPGYDAYMHVWSRFQRREARQLGLQHLVPKFKGLPIAERAERVREAVRSAKGRSEKHVEEAFKRVSADALAQLLDNLKSPSQSSKKKKPVRRPATSPTKEVKVPDPAQPEEEKVEVSPPPSPLYVPHVESHYIFKHMDVAEFQRMAGVVTRRFLRTKVFGAYLSTVIDRYGQEDLVSEVILHTLSHQRHSAEFLDASESPRGLIVYWLRLAASRVFWECVRRDRRWSLRTAGLRSLDYEFFTDGSRSTLHDQVPSGLPSPLTIAMALETPDSLQARGIKNAAPISSALRAKVVLRKAKAVFQAAGLPLPERLDGESVIDHATRLQVLAFDLRKDEGVRVDRGDERRTIQRAHNLLSRFVKQGVITQKLALEIRSIKDPSERLAAVEKARSDHRSQHGYQKPGPKPKAKPVFWEVTM